MTRRTHNHMTLKQASLRGLTLSEWCAHEQAEDALDAIEQARNERIVYGLICAAAACFTIALLMLGDPTVTLRGL